MESPAAAGSSNTRSPSSRIPNVATALVVIIGVVLAARPYVTALALSGQGDLSVEETRLVANSPQAEGPPKAPVVIAEFSDFQCPYCALASVELGKLREEFPDDVRLVFHHFPLSFHPYAMKAAIAAECAGDQGLFFRYHDQLFQNQRTIGKKSWRKFAEEVGVSNLTKFDNCVESREPLLRIAADTALGNRLRIPGTPAIFVNGRLYRGAGASELRQMIRRELAPEMNRWWQFWRRSVG